MTGTKQPDNPEITWGPPPGELGTEPGELPNWIGSYRILQCLGAGGMGVVYLAEQSEPVRRRVALKIIQAEMRGPETTLRFASERQALARLSHPNVAQLFEAGTTEFGHLFFAMELVEGIPITDYCDRGSLTLKDRLILLQTVCDGVQHAHQKGILHRDLKPDNILVTEIEGQAVPKIIDFGIAKAIDGPLVDGGLLTGDRVVGTPAYLAPEAVELVAGGFDIDTRSDVYALGVLLYELLIGVRPFDLHGKTFVEVLKTISEAEPTGLKERWNGLGEAAREKATNHRGTTVQVLGRSLEPDLNWIVLKAIDKDRKQRYGSATELSADIQRHLDHRPVKARRPSAAYRLGKFVRRRRGVVAAAGLILISLLLGVTGAGMGLVRANREAERANREAETTRKALKETQEVSRFLADLFEVSDPGEAMGSAITARELLERGARRIHSGFEDQPLARARFMVTIGDIYQKLGLFEKAEPLFLQSLETREHELGHNHLEISTSLTKLGSLYSEQGRFEDAERCLLRALEIRETDLGSGHSDVAETLHSLGLLYRRQGQYEKAEPHHLRALEIQEASLGPDHPDVAKSLNSLCGLYWSQGRYEKVVPVLKRALAIWENALGPDHPDVAKGFNNLGLVYWKMDRFEEAEPLYRRALETWFRVLGPDHPDVADPLHNLALLYWEQGRYEEAEPLNRQGLDIITKALGPDHPEVGLSLTNLGLLHWKQGRLELARTELQKSLSILKNGVEPDHIWIGEALWGLAGVSRDQGWYPEAEQLFRRALEIQEAALEPDHPDLRTTLTDFAQLLREMGRERQAELIETRVAAEDPSASGRWP